MVSIPYVPGKTDIPLIRKVINMADKSREYIYVEPEDYIPKDIYDMYFKDDDVMDRYYEILLPKRGYI